ncbi:FKBP-type peptidyl-prolyl cis-trans isomerase [Salmonella enterica]|nr:FKBP-type peptidyl-prolyl cis-trans isomerase [Salmonella enterica]
MFAAEKENSNIPELLKFAREYDQAGGNTGSRGAGASPRAAGQEATALRAQIARQKQSIERLRKELAALQAQSASGSTASRQETDARIRLAENAREKADRELQTMRAMMQEKEGRVSALEKQRLTDVEALKKVREQSDALDRKLREKETKTTSLQQQMENAGKKETGALRERLTQLQKRFREQEGELRRLQKQFTGREMAKKMNAAGVKNVNLNTPAARQAYVAGMTLGQNVLSMNQGDALLGMKVADPAVVLAGVRDMLAGAPVMSETAVEETYAGRDSLVVEAIKNTIAKEKKTAATWLETFRKQPGVKQTPSGLWYHIDYEGDEQLPSGDPVVDISVRESLTDGTTVNDMELTGAVMSMKLSEYPAVFREVIGLLRQHGRLTVVVPPDRAYGDKGLTPVIPPGATMIYMVQLESPAEDPAAQKTDAGKNGEKSQK